MLSNYRYGDIITIFFIVLRIDMLERPNWQEIVQKLLETRTQKELSKETGISQSTISEINQGAKKERLTFQSGTALISLYNKEVADDQT